jgi:hypothetical protein
MLCNSLGDSVVMKFDRIFPKVLLAGSLVIVPNVCCIFDASRAQAQVSTYQNSCSNISISGNVLSANCRKRDGQFLQSSLRLRGIENINGALTVTSSDRVSNFQLSCNSIFIRRNVLNATCQKINGNLEQTSITLNGIENINGTLMYTSDP